MGVDFLVCRNCGETFPDCGNFVRCECGNSWCDEYCAEQDGFVYESCKLGFEPNSEQCQAKYYSDTCRYHIMTSCSYCRNEKFEDSELLDYALKLLNKTKENLIAEYQNKR
ncbi:hypothetical protein [Anaerovorax sp. IOR16]|uniref:hypothetical protein n=1 Tax=Anaerovorax sp. IOR16 TaxID=2773458 RepID=UPI0019D26642|nr:hypothetical protein [Anaerovorax sp. IOR16]